MSHQTISCDSRYQEVSVATLIRRQLSLREAGDSRPLPGAIDDYRAEFPTYGLERLGIKHPGRVYRNLGVPKLVEHALARGEGVLGSNGALCVKTGKYTGRSPNDKFIVDESSSHGEIHWNKLNVPISEDNFRFQ